MAGVRGSGRASLLRSIGAFGQDGGAAASEVEQALTDSDAEVRAAAAWALSQMGPAGAKAVPGLIKSLADPNPRVRSMSAVALRAMGPKAVGAVPALMQALQDTEAYVRAPAADALGHMGPAAKPTASALGDRLLVNGEQTYVLRSIATALGDRPGCRDCPAGFAASPEVTTSRRLCGRSDP